MSQQQFNQQLCQFLQQATTPFHAVQVMSRQLAEAGFVELDDGQNWDILEITVDKSKPEWLDYPWIIPDQPSRDCPRISALR